MAASADADLWGTLGAQPAASPASPASPPPTSSPAQTPPTNDDGVWKTLGAPASSAPPATSPPETTTGILPRFGAAVVRGLHQGLDVPAEAAAGAFDRAANLFGYHTTQQLQTKMGDIAATVPYDLDPANAGIVPAAGRLAGETLATLPAAIGAGKIASSVARVGTILASRAAPYVTSLLRYLPEVAGGAAAGATTEAQTGGDIGTGALTGGVIGGVVPGGMALGNALLGSRNPAVVSAVAEHGIPLRVGQVSDSKIVRYLDDITAPEASNVAQRTAVTANAAQSMGVTPELAAANGLPKGQVTPAVMEFAKKLNGGVMGAVEGRTTIQQQPALDLANKLRAIATDASKTPSAFDDVKSHIKDIVDSIAANGGVLPGKIYGDLVATGTPLDVATRTDNSVVREYAGRIKEALQDAMQASATPEDATRYAEARLRYKNMMTLAPLVNKGTPGQISPLLLQGAANRSFKSNAFRGAGQLGDLGDLAQRYLKTPPQSGTEPRQLVRGTLYGDARALAGVVGTKTVGKVVQTVLGGNPLQPLGAASDADIATAINAYLQTRNALQP